MLTSWLLMRLPRVCAALFLFRRNVQHLLCSRSKIRPSDLRRLSDSAQEVIGRSTVGSQTMLSAAHHLSALGTLGLLHRTATFAWQTRESDKAQAKQMRTRRREKDRRCCHTCICVIDVSYQLCKCVRCCRCTSVHRILRCRCPPLESWQRTRRASRRQTPPDGMPHRPCDADERRAPRVRSVRRARVRKDLQAQSQVADCGLRETAVLGQQHAP